MFLNHKGCTQVVLKHLISSDGVQGDVHCGNWSEPTYSTLTIHPVSLTHKENIRIVARFFVVFAICEELNDSALSPHKIDHLNTVKSRG